VLKEYQKIIQYLNDMRFLIGTTIAILTFLNVMDVECAMYLINVM
jgi:hypothetical protein